jgi:hypothetical protein
MSLIRIRYIRAARALGVCFAWLALALVALAQSVSTTTVQGTVYRANGSSGSGTVQISWPAFTTAANQAVAAGKITASIGADGFVSVNLAPNLGSSPAGLYYTVVYHMDDGTTSTEYWMVPMAAQASIAQVRSQVMPAAQAVQAVSKAYVDQAIQSLAQGNLTSTGGQLTGPLYLTGDPTQALQAADKHYVDSSFAQAMPLTGGVATGPLSASKIGAAYQVDQFPGADFGAKLQACVAGLNSTYGGTCDARNFSGMISMAADVTIGTANAAVMLPCATLSTTKQIIITAGTRNVSMQGCSLRGASQSSGSQGGTVLLYSGQRAAIQVGDSSYATDTLGFHLDNVLINTTASTSAGAQALAAYRTQELDLENLYLLGNPNQTGITLDGTGNYTGGTFFDDHISGFQTAINGIGHQIANSAGTDWLNASTFLRLHIDCPTTNGSPISGTYGINLQQGDGNTFTGGDVENCGTALHLGANAQNNTIIGLRNENSIYQVVADTGSSYNSWTAGGTMFTGKLSDNGTRNSFLDTFHRSFNSLNGDWYGTQQDTTLTNHFRLGIGNGNERGLLNRYQTDYGYRWTMGLSDATGGEQFYQLLDELNNVYRLSVGQYNNGQSSTNNQTVINAAGTGAVVLNGSNNAGTGGVVFGSGGPNETTVATVSSGGNAQFNGTLQVGSTAQSAGTMTVRNNADSEVDYYLWPGLTTSQKGSFTYKDYNGNSQWFMVKDANNNWALNSALGGLDSFKAYQSTNSGDTYINASNSSGAVRVNYETGSGSAFNIYGGNSSNLYASFSGSSSIKLPGLSASSGRNCLQIDSSGYISNTGVACGTGTGSGTVNSGSAGQIAYYNGNGAAGSGMSTVPVASGGTGATTASAALSALNGVSLISTSAQTLAGPLNASLNSHVSVIAYGAKGDCVTDDTAAFTAAQTAAIAATPGQLPAVLELPKPPGGCYIINDFDWKGVPIEGQPSGLPQNGTHLYNVQLKSSPGHDIFRKADPSLTTGSNLIQSSWSIRNVSFVVNNSIQPQVVIGSNSVNAHRWPGRWFDDGAMTAGSAVFMSTRAHITCADVGQAIKVMGAGASGAPLISTIASVSPCWKSPTQNWTTFTLADPAQTTVTNAHTYISIMGLPVTQTLGNCGIAVDLYDGLSSTWVGSESYGLWGKLENVTFSSTSGTSGSGGANAYPCGIFIQGTPLLYGVDVRNFGFYGLYAGVVQAPTEMDSFYQSSSGDLETWDHGFFFSDTVPWLSYNGLSQDIKEIQITALSGFHIMEVGAQSFDNAGGWRIDIPSFENSGTATAWGHVITGSGHTITRGAMTNQAAGQFGYIEMTSGSCQGCLMNNTYLDGYGNTVTTAAGNTNFVNRGLNNHADATYNSNPYNGIPQAYAVSQIPRKGRSESLGRMVPDFLDDGNYLTPYSRESFLLWPTDAMPPSGSAWSNYVVADTTSKSGNYLKMSVGAPGISAWQTVLFDSPGSGGQITSGTNFPINTGATIYMSVKCPTGVTTFTPYWGNSGAGHVSQTFTCSTSYATYAMSLASLGGASAIANFQNAGSTEFDVAWLDVAPYVLVNGLSTTGGGTAIPTGPNSGTASGDIVCYNNTTGQQIDCGTFNATQISGTGSAHLTLKGGTAHGYITLNPASNGSVGVVDIVSGSTSLWRHGLLGGGIANYELKDMVNSHIIASFPSNMMPASLLGGNSNGATAITQATSDNSVNIATDAFVKAAIAAAGPLSGTSASIGGSALDVGACASGTVMVTGATTSMAVVVSPAGGAGPGSGFVWKGYVSSAGTVTVQVCAIAAATPTATTYNVRVIQ